MRTRSWHRVVGLVSAVSLVYLLLTGLPLQFSAELSLGQTYVTHPWVQARYSVEAPSDGVSSGPIQAIGGVHWYAGQPLSNASPSTQDGDLLLGALVMEPFVVVLTAQSLFLLEPDSGELERLQPPARPTAVGRRPQTQELAIDTQNGVFVTNDFDAWLPAADTRWPWASVEPLRAQPLTDLQLRYKNRVITYERWLQDLHSGRYFGQTGVWLVTLATLLLLVLATTGLVLWWRGRR